MIKYTVPSPFQFSNSPKRQLKLPLESKAIHHRVSTIIMNTSMDSRLSGANLSLYRYHGGIGNGKNMNLSPRNLFFAKIQTPVK